MIIVYPCESYSDVGGSGGVVGVAVRRNMAARRASAKSEETSFWAPVRKREIIVVLTPDSRERHAAE